MSTNGESLGKKLLGGGKTGPGRLRHSSYVRTRKKGERKIEAPEEERRGGEKGMWSENDREGLIIFTYL